MRTLEHKVKDNKFVFYIRTWYGIDKPEYDDIMTLNVNGVLSLIKELEQFVATAKKVAFINVDGMSMTLEQAITFREELNRKLKEFGE